MAQSATKTGFGDLPKEFRSYDTSAIAIVPVPYDGSSTWKKGADKGPAALLEASANMELYDIETQSEVYKRGIHTLPPVKHTGTPDGLVPKVEKAVAAILADSKFPVTLGGEHSISIGAMRAVTQKWSDLSILQIDAHGDTREEYHGSPNNHACVMARARELAPITQVGIRAIDAVEVPNMDKRRVFWGHDLCGRADDKWIDTIVAQQSKHVYVTIDLDAFDPSIMPATGTTEPGGLSWPQVNELLKRLCARRTVVGFDVVELLPTPGQWASEMLAAKLVYRFLSEVFERTGRTASKAPS
ncbi:MAG: agmatinase [Phycisphaerae bacterium]|nr:agmatinase [Phycisphaerae bacterium]